MVRRLASRKAARSTGRRFPSSAARTAPDQRTAPNQRTAPARPNAPTRPNAPFPPARRRALQRRLLAWYRQHARDLPWRRDGDPYGIWLSEIMLQQTRVAVVVPHYKRFRRRFPTIGDLARAGEEEVLEAWQGLGYYGRARRLASAAREIVRCYGGDFPADEEVARALPGVGRYTAGAILSIAFGRVLPVVDGNVARVLIRLELLDGNLDEPVTRRRLWEIAAALVPASTPGDWNQAVMELGALVCLPSASASGATGPDCAACPLRRLCRARAAGVAATLPPPRRRRAAPRVEVAVAWMERRGKLAVVQRRRDGVLAGFWELPEIDIPPGGDAAWGLARHLRELGFRAIEVGEELARIDHAMFHRRACMILYRVEARGRGRISRLDPASSVDGRPLTTATRKLIARACRHDPVPVARTSPDDGEAPPAT